MTRTTQPGLHRQVGYHVSSFQISERHAESLGLNMPVPSAQRMAESRQNILLLPDMYTVYTNIGTLTKHHTQHGICIYHDAHS